MPNNMDKQLIDNKLCSIIATYHDDATEKDYIIYTDETKDSDGRLNVYYGYYHLENDKLVVEKITDKADEEIALAVIEEVKKETIN